MRRRQELARYAAPAAFLLALTIAVLLIRSGLSGGDGTTTTTTAVTPTTAAATTTHAATTRRTGTRSSARFTVVERGDTFGSIATREGVSVQQLEALNPGVSSTSLTIGQRIRVK